MTSRGRLKTEFKTEESFCPTASEVKNLPAPPEVDSGI